MSLTVAAVQFEPEQHEHDRNRNRCVKLMAEAADRGAELVVAPEMATTGYCWTDRSHITPYVEPAAGPTATLLQEHADRTGATFVIGIAEVDPVTNIYYNSALIVGPDGLIDCYRKIQPFAADPRWAKDGDRGLFTTDTPRATIGTAICMDAMFPETIRTMSLLGADIICLPVNWFGERTPSSFWQARAYENGLPLIAANRWGNERGTDFAGGSCIIGPDGEILAVLDTGDGIVTADIDITAVRATRSKRLAGRKPSCYHTLSLSTHAWNPQEYYNLFGEHKLSPGQPARLAAVQSAYNPDWRLRLTDAADLVSSVSPCDIAVLPPLFEPDTADEAERAAVYTDEALSLLRSTAHSLNTSLVTTIVTADQRPALIVVLVEPQGTIHYYQPVHSPPWSPAGNHWTTVDLDSGRIGLLSAQELTSPESTRCLALSGADIACIPGYQPLDKDWLLRIRAGENNMFAVCAVYADHQGTTGIFGPDAFAAPHREVTASPGINVVTVDIDLTDTDRPARTKPLLVMRHPTWFDTLVIDSNSRQEE